MPLPTLPEDKQYLVIDNLNLIHWVLRKKLGVTSSHSSYDDYFQEGCIGLIISAIRFDESKGYKFVTFAVPNILGCILRYKRDCEFNVKAPRKIKNIIFKVIKYSNLGYTIREIEEITGIKSSDIADALNVSSVRSINELYAIGKDKDEVTLENFIASPVDEIEEKLSEENVLNSIQKVSNSISTEVHRAIWEEYIYSMFYGEKLNQKYFVEKYNITQASVSRILDKYNNKFKRILKDSM